MCIIKKVFYYEETKLPVIKYKDEIWVKANTVANILEYKNTMKSIQDQLTLKTKENCQNWGPNPNITLCLDLGLQSKHNESFCLERNEKNAIYINEYGLYSLEYGVYVIK